MNSVDNSRTEQWYKVCMGDELKEGHRIHVEVNGRYITIFRSKGALSSIDAGKLKLVLIYFLLNYYLYVS